MKNGGFETPKLWVITPKDEECWGADGMEKISPNLNLHFPNLSLQMVSDQIQETFCSKATKTSQDAVKRW